MKLVFAVPGDLNTPTGGYVYDKRIVAELRGMGWQVEVLDLGDGFPFADDARLMRARDKLARSPSDVPLVVDGLALGVLPEAATNLCESHRLIALVHHPLAYEAGLRPEQRTALEISEQQALSQVKAVIVTSESTKSLLVSHYRVPAAAIAVVKPGNDRVTAAGGGGERLSLLAVGSLVPRKGYDVLVAALSMLKELPWTMTIAGDRTRDTSTAQQLEQQIASSGLSDRIHLAGAVSDEALAGLYSRADVFVLASRFEGYGMALADATAYGLPVVATNAGAIPEAVPAEASILVPPDDASALANALRRVISEKSFRETLAANARAAASHLPAWRDQATLFARAVEAAA